MEILIHPSLVLQGIDAGNAVINVIVRQVIDVVLLLPEAPLFHKGIVRIIQMGLILLLQGSPKQFSLLRSHFRILIDNVLELIHHGAVGNKHQELFKMHGKVVLCPIPEK